MTKSIEIKVPDIGDYKDVPVIDVLVNVGDTVEREQSLVTLESDKATIDIPSIEAGRVNKINVKAGDKVSEGTMILLLEISDEDNAAAAVSIQNTQNVTVVAADEAKAEQAPALAPAPAIETKERAPVTPVTAKACEPVHASPAVRKLAREQGVDLHRLSAVQEGSGPKGRITKEDVQVYLTTQTHPFLSVCGAQAQDSDPLDAGNTLNLLPWPKTDFAKFGPTESKPLSRIQKLSGANLHRNWVRIPHVTNHEEADITELEAFRVQLNQENKSNESHRIKVTLLAFLMKACVAALQQYPHFNASLDEDHLVYKQYYHIGFAADTPHGLVVPVIREVDRKGIFHLAQEAAELAKLAREGQLKAEQMQGGCFSISSLGGIGSTYFTPIINAPEVAILGVSRSNIRPVWDGKRFNPRLILPLSLSYDHRVIDGAAAARFNVYLARVLADFRRVML